MSDTPKPRRLVIVFSTPPIEWPWGKRAILDQTGVRETLPPDAPVEYWVCCRVDEPWTWRILSNQHVGVCTTCAGEIVYRVSAISPDESTKKICRRCAERLVAKP